jgi:activating signal cointegrator complex subunit 2
MDHLPSFAPYPPAKLRLSIAPVDWEKCLDAWIFLAESHLRLPQTHLQSLNAPDRQNVAKFVTSYVRELSESSDTVLKTDPKAARLYKLVFMLYRGLLLTDDIPKTTLQWDTLSAFARVFQHISEARTTLAHLWTKHAARCEESFLGIKKQLIQKIESSESSACIPVVLKLLPLFHLSPQTAAFFAIGSDLVDGFTKAFSAVNLGSGDQQTVTVFIYLILLSLLQIPKRNTSLLSDHLYTLKADAKKRRGHSESHPSLLESLVSNTPIIKRLKAMSDHSDSDSFETIDAPRDITAGLLEFQSKKTWPKKHKASKSVVAANEAVEAVHIHQMSLITQVQDLFPDLGSAFVAKLLDEYSENVEQVIAHLLDGSLPDYLAVADRSEQLQAGNSDQKETPPEHQPLAPRRNIHDGDALDTLAVSASQLRLSKGHGPTPEDALLPSAANKAAILAALARFDADDDERDDTYDAADVGGTVDARPDDPALRPAAAAPAAPGGLGDEAERALWAAWRRDGAAAFARDPAARRSAARARLRQESGCADEVLEGWAAMLAREPARLRALERRFAGDEWRGGQAALRRTAWRDERGDGEEEDEDEDDEAAEGRGAAGGYRPRGGEARGGRGGAAAGGPSGERGTLRARRGKEVRGSNRRINHAKKMARGMA